MISRFENIFAEFCILLLFLLFPCFLFGQQAQDTVVPFYDGAIVQGVSGPVNVVYSTYLMYPLSFWNSTYNDGMSPAVNVSGLPVSSPSQWSMVSAPGANDYCRILRYHVFSALQNGVEYTIQSPFYQSSSSYATHAEEMHFGFQIRNPTLIIGSSYSGRVKIRDVKGNYAGVWQSLLSEISYDSDWYSFDFTIPDTAYIFTCTFPASVFYKDNQPLRNIKFIFDYESSTSTPDDATLTAVWSSYLTLCPHSPVCHVTTVMVDDPDHPLYGETISYCDRHFQLAFDSTGGTPDDIPTPDPEEPDPENPNIPSGGINGTGNTGTQNNTVNNTGGDTTNTFNQSGDNVTNNVVNNYWQPGGIENRLDTQNEYISGIASNLNGEYALAETPTIGNGFIGGSAPSGSSTFDIADDALSDSGFSAFSQGFITAFSKTRNSSYTAPTISFPWLNGATIGPYTLLPVPVQEGSLLATCRPIMYPAFLGLWHILAAICFFRMICALVNQISSSGDGEDFFAL